MGRSILDAAGADFHRRHEIHMGNRHVFRFHAEALQHRDGFAKGFLDFPGHVLVEIAAENPNTQIFDVSADASAIIRHRFAGAQWILRIMASHGL